MTLEELNAHRSLVEDLNEARDLLEALRSSALRASYYDGMPRAAATIKDRTESLAIRCAKLESQIESLQKAVRESEGQVNAFISMIPDRRTALVFQLRFVDGYEWQGVAAMIGGKNTESGVKSLCYRYLRSQAL